MSTCIYLLRHGETEFSKSGGYCGTTDAELTGEGELMAADFAQKYSKLKWQAIYASPMKRTIATASPLAEACSLTLDLREGLKEISYGEWEGKTQKEVLDQYKDSFDRWHSEPAWNAPPKGETTFEIAERAMSVVQEALSQHPSGNVLFVSHKATIRIIICCLMGIELGRYRDRVNALAASVSMVKFNSHGPMLELLGDRSHLRPELLEREGT